MQIYCLCIYFNSSYFKTIKFQFRLAIEYYSPLHFFFYLYSHQGFELCENFLIVITGNSFVVMVYNSTADSNCELYSLTKRSYLKLAFLTKSLNRKWKQLFFSYLSHTIIHFSMSWVHDKKLTYKALFVFQTLKGTQESLILNSKVWWVVISPSPRVEWTKIFESSLLIFRSLLKNRIVLIISFFLLSVGK